MIKGMTGFGSAPFIAGGARGLIEIKTVNHRYFDISFYLPIGFNSLENKIQQLVNRHIKRGKVVVSVKIVQKPAAEVSLNKGAIKKYTQYAKALQREFGLKNDLSLSDLLRMPGVVEVKETLIRPNDIWKILDTSMNRCMKDLLVMRKREGSSLAKDVRDKLMRMKKEIQKIKKRSRIILAQAKRKLPADEFSAFQKSNDINEEISRLSHYVAEVNIHLRDPSPVGKKLDFVAQEMQRETNTIGSKMQDKIVANAVVSLKSKIEKIREQAQNTE